MIYRLAKNNYTIEVSSLGAELVSLKKEGVNYLWTKTQPYWQRHAPVLFPIVGKLKDNTYFYDGNEYHLPQHGFARDAEFELTEKTSESLVFRLSENKNINYPFQFDFYIKYSLNDSGLTTTYIIENNDNKNLPFSVGAHPGFLCPLLANELLEDYYFEFDNDTYLTRTQLHEGLLTSQTESIKLESKKLFLSEELFKNDALVISDFKSRSIALKCKKYSLNVFWEDCTYLGLWKQPQAPFVCIEPWWGVADSLNHNGNILEKKGINNIRASEKKEFWFRIEIQ